MGLFDTIQVRETDKRFACSGCGHIPSEFQTKDIGEILEVFRIEENTLVPVSDPASTMGEGLPHGWLNIYVTCKNCAKWVEFDVKFTDGTLMEVKEHGS